MWLSTFILHLSSKDCCNKTTLYFTNPNPRLDSIQIQDPQHTSSKTFFPPLFQSFPKDQKKSSSSLTSSILTSGNASQKSIAGSGSSCIINSSSLITNVMAIGFPSFALFLKRSPTRLRSSASRVRWLGFALLPSLAFQRCQKLELLTQVRCVCETESPIRRMSHSSWRASFFAFSGGAATKFPIERSRNQNCVRFGAVRVAGGARCR